MPQVNINHFPNRWANAAWNETVIVPEITERGHLLVKTPRHRAK